MLCFLTSWYLYPSRTVTYSILHDVRFLLTTQAFWSDLLRQDSTRLCDTSSPTQCGADQNVNQAYVSHNNVHPDRKNVLRSLRDNARHPTPIFLFLFFALIFEPICTIISMKHRITVSLLLLVLTSVNAFSSAPRSNLFREQTKIHKFQTERQNGVKSPRTPLSSLSAAPAAAAVAGAVTGGLFAGGLHAIAGKWIDALLGRTV
jgi:hypothetical protein